MTKVDPDGIRRDSDTVEFMSCRPSASKSDIRHSINGDPCQRTAKAKEQKENRLEADHRPACQSRARSHREVTMVCPAMENRGVPQGPEVRLPGRGSAAADCRTPDDLLAVFCILSWRVFWMTMMNRAAPDAVAKLVLTSTEIALLDRLIPHKQSAASRRKTLVSST